MNKIQDAYYLDGKPYSDLSDNDKKTFDMAADKLKEWEATILSFENPIVNIITTHPQRSLVIESNLGADDLTGKMIYAYTQSKSNG